MRPTALWAGDVAQAHPQRGLAAQHFESIEELAVGIELVLGFVAGLAHRRGGHEHQRRRQVDARHLDAVDDVEWMTSRQ